MCMCTSYRGKSYFVGKNIFAAVLRLQNIVARTEASKQDSFERGGVVFGIGIRPYAVSSCSSSPSIAKHPNIFFEKACSVSKTL